MPSSSMATVTPPPTRSSEFSSASMLTGRRISAAPFGKPSAPKVGAATYRNACRKRIVEAAVFEIGSRRAGADHRFDEAALSASLSVAVRRCWDRTDGQCFELFIENPDGVDQRRRENAVHHPLQADALDDAVGEVRPTGDQRHAAAPIRHRYGAVVEFDGGRSSRYIRSVDTLNCCPCSSGLNTRLQSQPRVEGNGRVDVVERPEERFTAGIGDPDLRNPVAHGDGPQGPIDLQRRRLLPARKVRQLGNDVGLRAHVLVNDLLQGRRHLLDESDGLGEGLGDQDAVALGPLQHGEPGDIGEHHGGTRQADGDDRR
jgi:hypothetical protein